MKTLVFSRSVAECSNADCCIDLSPQTNRAPSGLGNPSPEFSSVLDRFGPTWFKQFSEWLGELNRVNADLHWWAHASTAKNMLSSPLGDRFIQVEAVCEIARNSGKRVVAIIGATPGQMESIASSLPPGEFRFTGKDWARRRLKRAFLAANTLARQLVLTIRVLIGFFGYDKKRKALAHAELCLFTYADAPAREGIDNYFGALPDLIYGERKATSALYLVYAYAPYRRRLNQLFNAQPKAATPYVALFQFLRMSDLFWALSTTVREWWRNIRSSGLTSRGVGHRVPLLQEAFLHDLAFAEYLNHLLAYRSIRRFLQVSSPKILAYPFENKSLEKMILLGAADSVHKPRIVGYQHTSITQRHSAFTLSPAEARATPLPEKVVTVGSVTKNYLEALGGYPENIFIAGCALRQKWNGLLPRHSAPEVRLLLALSSSKHEMIQAVEFSKRLLQLAPEFKLGIRPHNNFPLTLLPKELAIWVDEHALNFSGTELQENLNWCSVTIYVSSTVALEALMRGRPIVNFPIGDVASTDPVLGASSFHWCVENEREMVSTLEKIYGLSEDEYQGAATRAVKYVREYLAPIDRACIQRGMRDIINDTALI